MKGFEGMDRKFTVLKNEDIEKHLDEGEKSELSRILWKVDQLRSLEGKGFNVHLVINIDEHYAPEVVDILKRNGHWGDLEDRNQIAAAIEDDVMILPAYHMGD